MLWPGNPLNALYLTFRVKGLCYYVNRDEKRVLEIESCFLVGRAYGSRAFTLTEILSLWVVLWPKDHFGLWFHLFDWQNGRRSNTDNYGRLDYCWLKIWFKMIKSFIILRTFQLHVFFRHGYIPKFIIGQSNKFFFAW